MLGGRMALYCRVLSEVQTMCQWLATCRTDAIWQMVIAVHCRHGSPQGSGPAAPLASARLPCKRAAANELPATQHSHASASGSPATGAAQEEIPLHCRYNWVVTVTTRADKLAVLHTYSDRLAGRRPTAALLGGQQRRDVPANLTALLLLCTHLATSGCPRKSWAAPVCAAWAVGHKALTGNDRGKLGQLVLQPALMLQQELCPGIQPSHGHA